ncbi:MAG: DUF554 domain-containing protein, partial [Clostridiales bacterium]|nr:DUF554 domain-containing protein [Clostridiales bacterium]
AAVIIGGGIGMLVRGGIKQRFQDILMQALGLSTLFIGVSGALKGMFTVNGEGLETGGTMVLILSLVLGALIGEGINIEKQFERFGEWLKRKVKSSGDSRFVEGFVTASLVICVGAMAVVGSLQDGLTGDASMLYTKSILDFVIVLVLASALGKGVLFSALPLGILQGSITLFAGVIAPVLSDRMIDNLSFIGSALIFCVGINLCFGKKIKVGNLLPALVIALLAALIPVF